VRLALARLSGDSTLEASLFIKTGKQARKSGLYNIAANCFAQAETAILSIRDGQSAGLDMSSLRIQVAKLKHDCGRSNAALRMLGLENIETNIQLTGPELSAESALYVKNALGMDGETPSNDAMNSLFAKRLLQSTRWMIDGGLKAGTEVVRRFEIIHKLAPKWEKGFFQHAKFVHSMLESRANLLLQRLPFGHSIDDEERLRCFMTDRICQRNVKQAMQSYSQALSLDTKHVYQALPRLLSLWFDLTSIGGSHPDLSEAQACANRFMAEKFLDIPAEAFYTAIPQLISSVVHKNPETAKVVRGILARVLERFPAQAMWPLAWLRQSQHKERCKAGESIFRDAERILAQAKSSRYLLLVASKALFIFLQDLAKRNVCSKSNKIKLTNTWEGEVELCEFIPPVQAALQVSLSIDKREIFPRQVPRMRAFDATVSVMTSKARPRKLVAYVVSNIEHVRVDPKGARAQRRRSMDIGELHFLIKQEAKGDLRKDARVQDLNNVINRLMSSANESKRSAQHGRRLHLRTFAVTCLSEDTGILEWVPQTAPFRTLVASCYNPLASELSRKRRGGHITNFTDPSLKRNFTAAQEAFLIEGDLKKATHLFEELSLKQCPPLFYWWFVHTFRDPASWYEARTAFTISTAVWSAVGHVIGLGDRHSENILIDTSSGACVHVDFDCIFDKGLTLPRPEVVPFRLTQNMLDGFGPTGADGLYTTCLHSTMSTLRNNRDTLLSVLEPFVKDPVIDWGRRKSHKTAKAIGTNNNSSSKHEQREEQKYLTEHAKRNINTIDERLKGIYNLRNPNLRKISRQDGNGSQHYNNHLLDEDESAMLVPLSVEGQVHKMIAEATSHENLLQLYIGWMPWV